MDELKGYQWPASALTRNDMKILCEWHRKTGTPISQLLKQAIEECDKIIRKNQPRFNQYNRTRSLCREAANVS